MPTTHKGRDFLRIADFEADDIKTILEHAQRLKTRQRERIPHRHLEDRTLALIFEKPSTRTRVSFEVGMAQLGGTALDLQQSGLQLGTSESLRDTAIVLSRYVDGIVFRTHDQVSLDELALHAEVPVINGLTNVHHPCQALADLMTIKERFDSLDNVHVTFLGDGNNNVCHSLIEACAAMGMSLVVGSPAGYEPAEDVRQSAAATAALTGATIGYASNPREAARGADVLYTDVWTSMGKEDETARRRADFALFGLDKALVDEASERAIIMHCLPAHVGEEVTEDVLYGERSAVWDQAENRLHAQKALLTLIIR